MLQMHALLNRPRSVNAKPSSFWEDPTQKIGIELEWEDQAIRVAELGSLSQTHPSKLVLKQSIFDTVDGWGVVLDHSLRGDYPYEILTLHPYGGARLAEIMASYTAWVESYKLQPCLSEQTSTHIHIDIRRWTLRQVQSFLIAFIYLEEDFFALWGPHRRNNPFCVALSDLVSHLVPYAMVLNYEPDENNLEETQTFLESIRDLLHKYASLNLKPMWTLGSIELRLMRGLVSSEDIVNLINYIFTITRFSKKHSRLHREQYIEHLKSTFKIKGSSGDLTYQLTTVLSKGNSY